MAERIRFHLDEHVHPAIARALRSRGIDVTTTNEAGLRTQADQAQLDYICREHRVLVTYDRDFLRLASQTLDHPGIAYCEKEKANHSIGYVINALVLMYEIYLADEMLGRVEFL